MVIEGKRAVEETEGSRADRGAKRRQRALEETEGHRGDKG
jgi:hypothetical protein